MSSKYLYLLIIWCLRILMETLREVQVQSLAVVFAGLRMVSKVPQLLRRKHEDTEQRESPPSCLSDPLLGRHQYVKINDIKYHYVESGSRRNQMVFCLHDFTDFWYGWRKQLRGLSGSNWVVAPDLKGFGDSEKPFLPGKYKDDIILQELRKFVAILQDSERPIVLLGHGLGGQLAWKFVERYPEIVAKFVSISTPHPKIWLKHVMKSWRSIFEHRWLYMCRIPLLPERELLQNDLEIFDKRFKKSSSVMDLSTYSNFDKEAYKYTFSRRQDWQGPVNYYRNLPLADTSVLQETSPAVIPVDTLFLVGNMDPEVSLEMVSQSAEYVTRFAVQIVNMAGHSPHQDHPELVNRYIAKFIKGGESVEGNTTPPSSPADISQLPDARRELLEAYYPPGLPSLEAYYPPRLASITSIPSNIMSGLTNYILRKKTI